MKDTFYFSHDYSSRSDEKIKLLVRRHGMLGYGCFWSIIEDLYQNANALRTDYDGIAYDLRIGPDVIKSVITEFDLFVIDGEMFGSLSVERRLNERNTKSIKARESANYRWEKSKLDANALRPVCEGNAIKESKVKESKEKETMYVYSEFYDKQISISKEDKSYLFFVKFIFGENETDEKLSGLLSIKKQLTFKNFNLLLKKSKETGIKLMDSVLKIENDPKYYKGKQLLYSTLNNWLSERFIK